MALDRTGQLELFSRMVRIRKFEEALIAHHPVGHLSIGQEAAIAGACMALRDDDYVTGTHRSHGHPIRSEEHTSELQSLMRISYAVFCLKKKTRQRHRNTHDTHENEYIIYR